jgi:hypothetical protein
VVTPVFGFATGDFPPDDARVVTICVSPSSSRRRCCVLYCGCISSPPQKRDGEERKVWISFPQSARAAKKKSYKLSLCLSLGKKKKLTKIRAAGSLFLSVVSLG